MKKRLWSLLLVVVMVIALLPVNAFAAPTRTIISHATISWVQPNYLIGQEPTIDYYIKQIFSISVDNDKIQIQNSRLQKKVGDAWVDYYTLGESNLTFGKYRVKLDLIIDGSNATTHELSSGFSYSWGNVNTRGSNTYICEAYSRTYVYSPEFNVDSTEHRHYWSTNWYVNETSHWMPCIGASDCAVSSGSGEHNKFGNIAHKDATCTEAGVVGGTYCSVCKYGKDDAEKIIPALGHEFPSGFVRTAATCTTTGTLILKCSRCNTSMPETIPALGHSWDGGAVRTAATALTAGEKVYNCSRCQATKSEVIPKIAATGWQQINGTWYYFNADGTLAKNEWIDGYWINADGSWTYQPRGSWKQDSTGWWYGDTSGWYAANGSQKIDGVVYYFNASGYWVEGSSNKSGWQQEGGNWYYYSNGNKATGWLNDGGTWYYMNSLGVMTTGWQNVGGTWYYMNSSGAMQTGWINPGGTWYYLKTSGAMAANEWCDGYWLNGDGSWTYQYRGSWKQDSTGWWYGDTSGWYAANGTQKIDDVVYTFDARGYWVN